MGFVCQVVLYLCTTRWSDAVKPHAAYVFPAITCANYLTSMCMLSAVAFTMPVRYFPQNRGQAIAIVKSFVGLGGAFVTQVYKVMHGNSRAPADAFQCILLWSGTTLSSAALAAWMMPSEEAKDSSRSSEPSGMLPRSSMVAPASVLNTNNY